MPSSAASAQSFSVTRMVRKLIAARRQKQRDQLIVTRQTSLAKTADVIRGMIEVARRLPMTMAAAVPEHDAPAGCEVRIDRRVRMFR